VSSVNNIESLRDYCLRNASGLITPANSGLILALAIFELADAQREHTDQVRRLANEAMSLVNTIAVGLARDLK
jgi:hypothetical protein